MSTPLTLANLAGSSLASSEIMLATNWERLQPRLIESIWETLYMVSLTMLAGGIAGLVVGVLLTTTRRGGILQNGPVYWLLNLLVNIIRPIPFIILIAAIGPVTKAAIGTTVGTEAATFVMAIAATFAVARIVEQNLVAVDPGVIEAARAMGASPARIIWDVLVKEALGPIILGYTFIFIAVIDMSAMAGYIGGGGLGDFAITYGYKTFDWNVTLVATIIIIVMVQLAQGLGNWLSHKVMHR